MTTTMMMWIEDDDRRESMRLHINMSHTIQSCQIRINVLQYISPCFFFRLLWWHLILWPFLEKKRKKKISTKNLFYFLKIASIRNGCFLLIFSTIKHHPLSSSSHYPIAFAFEFDITVLSSHRRYFIQQSKH